MRMMSSKHGFRDDQMPADGIALPLKKQDFGTSRWQLADYLNARVYRIHGLRGGRKGRLLTP
jgi:hypothetical protein